MERTVPRTDSDEIELYIRTYYSLLRSSGEVSIETLVETHESMESLLHPHARGIQIDSGAFAYAAFRLPTCIVDTRLILLGQRSAVFERWGYPVNSWTHVSADARRRRAAYDDDETLALYITSRSDIDDILPTLTAYQIEWNKLHLRLNSPAGEALLAAMADDPLLSTDEHLELLRRVDLPGNQYFALLDAWGEDCLRTFQTIASERKRFAVRLLAGSLVDYRKAIRHWWDHIEDSTVNHVLENRRVYFVSSNPHSLMNLWSGYALRQQSSILGYLQEENHRNLLAEYQKIQADAVPSSVENFFYFALRDFLHDSSQAERADHADCERTSGIIRIQSEHGPELDAQIIDLSQIQPHWIDPRLRFPHMDILRESDAVIVNIDYPLGMAAYEVMTRVSENVGQIEGVYIMGKSATLNGRIGDVMIPTVVHDDHSANTFMFNNCFTAQHVAPYLAYGTVLDNQKAVTVRGTFLQNARFMGVFYREGFTDIEMEAGPYLSALYELMRPKRHPYNEIVSLHQARFDIGMIHYASDKPLSKGQNLGAGSLAYRGMDPTYAASLAILKRIMLRETHYLQEESTTLTSEVAQ